MNFKEMAIGITEELKDASYGVVNGTGYYSVKTWKIDDEEFDRCVDVSKCKDDDGIEYYSVYVSYEDEEDGSWYCTETLDVNELAEILENISLIPSKFDVA